MCVYLFILAICGCPVANAQIPEVKEPHHKIVFENKYIRLIDLQIKPGDTTLMHTHDAASVVVFLTKSTFAIENQGQPAVKTDVEPGNTVYRNYDEKPVTHRVWILGALLFRCFVVEIKKAPFSRDTCFVLSQPGMKNSWQQKSVRVYNIDILKDQSLSLPKANCPYLLVSVSGLINTVSSRRKKSLEPGGFVFISSQQDLQIRGTPNENSKCILLELK
jgi:hypothetical protein